MVDPRRGRDHRDHRGRGRDAAHGAPEHIRSDNGPEFIAHAVQGWLKSKGVKTLYIQPGSPWENAYIESFHDKLL